MHKISNIFILANILVTLVGDIYNKNLTIKTKNPHKYIKKASTVQHKKPKNTLDIATKPTLNTCIVVQNQANIYTCMYIYV